MTNSLKQITTPKPSRHPHCPARFHGVGVDRSPCVPSISFDTRIASSLGSRRPVSGTGWPRPCNRAFLLVLFAADLLHPAHDLAVEFLLDGEVRQRAVWRGAVPMFLSGRAGDHIPGMNLFDGTPPALHKATTRRHDERLTQRVGAGARECGGCWRRGGGCGRGRGERGGEGWGGVMPREAWFRNSAGASTACSDRASRSPYPR